MISLLFVQMGSSKGYSHVTRSTPNIFNILNAKFCVQTYKLFLCVIKLKIFLDVLDLLLSCSFKGN